ncbi:MAG: DEAD/DEAH box helicase, partial [Phycisphaerae bacterium]
LNTCLLTAQQVYEETLKTLFHAPGGGLLYVEQLKGASGEIALRIGAENEPFGVINVGEAGTLVKLCNEKRLATGEREFSGSLFHQINQPDSSVNLLIGSKKFTEGWSSWRVSTMGLMNVGQGEGAQIIQLFGRGVRLKGYAKCLKRSGRSQLPDGVERPKHLPILETLGIFGIHADYMAQFRDYLEEEGLPTNDDRIELLLPVFYYIGTLQLKTFMLL